MEDSYQQLLLETKQIRLLLIVLICSSGAVVGITGVALSVPSIALLGAGYILFSVWLIYKYFRGNKVKNEVKQ